MRNWKVASVGVGSDYKGAQGALENMDSVLFLDLSTCYTGVHFVKIHQALHSRFVHFSEYILYFKKYI